MGLISSLLKYIVLAFSIFNNKLCISRIFFAQTASACPITIKPRQKPFFSILYRKFSWHKKVPVPASIGPIQAQKYKKQRDIVFFVIFFFSAF